MLQQGGAMALFVLRLTGLLSLEKAIHDNTTSTPTSVDNASYVHLMQPQESKLIYNIPGNLPGDLPGNLPGDLPGNLSGGLPEGLPGGLSGNITINSSVLSVPDKHVNNNELSNTFILNASASKNGEFYYDKRKKEDSIKDINIEIPTIDKNINLLNISNGSIEVHQINGVKSNISNLSGNSDSVSAKHETLDIKDGIHKIKVKDISLNKHKNTKERTDEGQDNEEQLDKLQIVNTKPYKSSNISDAITPSQTVTGSKPGSIIHKTNSLNVSNEVSEISNDKLINGSGKMEKENVPNLADPQSLQQGPLPGLNKDVQFQSMLENDELVGFLEKSAQYHGIQSLNAAPEQVVAKDFEYYDFDSIKDTSFNYVPPALISHSLIRAVPNSGSDKDTIKENIAIAKQNNAKENSKTSEPRKGTKIGPVLPKEPVPPITTSPPKRNNPYPYGPKVLPGHYSPSRHVPGTWDNDQINPPAEIGRTVKPNHTLSKSRAGRGDTTNGIPGDNTTTENGHNFDYYYYDGSKDFKVLTAEPPVLFHFEKPGYHPQPPTTLSPPTRAPTPSDPWDCAPRCPMYNLLDWNTDYDIRQYPASRWISTVIISDNRVLAELEGYMKVQDYFCGLNDRGKLLNLTVPYVTQIKYGRHPGVLDEVDDFTVSLYVQPTYYTDHELPTPISNEVLVDALEPKTVFVHGFEANVWEVTNQFLDERIKKLMENLRHQGEAFLDRYFYLASYTRPKLYQPVYYELWVYSTTFRAPHTPPHIQPPTRKPSLNQVTKNTIKKLCRGVECPPFEVLRTYKYGIQKRRYYDALFASTSPGECHFSTVSVWKGFMPLHLYKHGINSHMEVLEATRPIALVRVRDDGDPNTECPQNMTMSLYLPKRLHSNPPITGYAAPAVQVTMMDDVIVYAYTVGGYLLQPDRVRQELADLKHRLVEFGACFKNDEYYVAVYDFIARYHGRQNEIWVVAENCKATFNG